MLEFELVSVPRMNKLDFYKDPIGFGSISNTDTQLFDGLACDDEGLYPMTSIENSKTNIKYKIGKPDATETT